MDSQSSKPASKPTQPSGQQKPPKLVTIRSGLEIDPAAKEWSGKLTSVKFPKVGQQSKGGFLIGMFGGIACKGVLGDPNVGAMYKFVGEFIENTTYNSWEFKFSSYQCTVDAEAGLREYLSRECKHIGDAAARKLISAFGNSTMVRLRQSPKEVQNVIKCNETYALEIQKWANGEHSNASIKEKLYGIGLQPSKVNSLIKEYGNNAEKKIKEDCFTLTSIHGFGFKTVDKIAELIGIPKDDPGRIKAALVFVMNEQCEQEGHTCIRGSELIRETCGLLDLHQQKIVKVLATMIEDGSLCTDQTKFEEPKIEPKVSTGNSVRNNDIVIPRSTPNNPQDDVL